MIMANRNKAVVWTVVVLSILIIAGAVAFFIIRKKKGTDTLEIDPQSGKVTEHASVTASGVIKYGDRGENVKKLQEYLNRKLTSMYYLRGGKPLYGLTTIDRLDVDGIFGAKTLCVTKWCFNKESVKLSELV